MCHPHIKSLVSSEKLLIDWKSLPFVVLGLITSSVLAE